MLFEGKKEAPEAATNPFLVSGGRSGRVKYVICKQMEGPPGLMS